MKNIKAVLFDMDGLMFDTERLAVRFWKEAGAEFGLTLGDEFLLYSRGSRMEEAWKLFSSCYGEDADYLGVRAREKELFFGYLKDHEIPVKPGLYELLAWLKEQEIKVILATSTVREVALGYLERTGVISYFDGYVCGDMITKSKPDPQIFYKAAELAGCLPSECAVLEDSYNGIYAAIAGGFHAVMVVDLMEPLEDMKEKLWARCDSLFEVKELLC